MRTGVINLPLHYGSVPNWLFERMKLLAQKIVLIILEEQGQREFLIKLANPLWFQSLGCVLGFDWHSSGLTTAVCGALKEAFRGLEKETGLFICGGKGNTSRKTPQEITQFAYRYSLPAGRLIYASRMSAKIDNSALLDNYQLYHHTFIFTPQGDWTVIQQGMNEQNRFARRYHWLSFKNGSVFSGDDFVCEPHMGIASQTRENKVIDLTAKKSEETREICAQIASEKPAKVLKQFKKIQEFSMPAHHEVKNIKPENLKKILIKTYQRQPENFQKVLEIEGVGPKTLRALALISELIYGAPPSFKDPAKFSFAHGGKDGYPYSIKKREYENSILILERAIKKAKLDTKDKLRALRNLYYGN